MTAEQDIEVMCPTRSGGYGCQWVKGHYGGCVLGRDITRAEQIEDDERRARTSALIPEGWVMVRADDPRLKPSPDMVTEERCLERIEDAVAQERAGEDW